MARASAWDEQRGGREIPRPTMPVFKLDDRLIEIEAREAAARVVERKVIRAGRDAWHEIGRAESFEAWCRIGAALAVGKAYALKATGANAPWGRSRTKVEAHIAVAAPKIFAP